MLKLFNSTDTSFSSNGDKTIIPTKAKIHLCRPIYILRPKPIVSNLFAKIDTVNHVFRLPKKYAQIIYLPLFGDDFVVHSWRGIWNH